MSHVRNERGTDTRRRVPRLESARLDRMPVSIPAEAEGATAVARDLTDEGVRVVSTRSHPVGRRFALRLMLPGFAPIDVACEVRWVDFHSDGRLYDMGCRFVHTRQSAPAVRLLAKEIAAGSIPEAKRPRKR